ncbi:hypothetical protein [Ekhidna sp.]|uniref:hypothetical protein n=1 Tax=Ekhidna sp. TaxID=2608089 RepID=UPI003BA947D5
MKRALSIVATVFLLGISTTSCETTSNLEEVVVEDSMTDSSDDKDDVKAKPGSN